MPRPIDLRSDTVTKPSEAMRSAMAAAEVGDDWYGDDPSVNRLQERAAEVTGTEAALYVATGTMANQISLHVQTHPGQFVVCPREAHVGGTEVVSSALLSGLAFVHVPWGPDGYATAEGFRAALEPDPFDVDVAGLVAVEQTHQVGGGVVTPRSEMAAIAAEAHAAGFRVHMDGARLFNAAAAAGVPATAFAEHADTLMFCLSKGLGAPIGSVICGDAAFIREAKRARVLLGGAWRQAGIMAAAGLIALEEGPKRLHEDHEHARLLAEGIAAIDSAFVDPRRVQTNIVFVDTAPLWMRPWEVLERLRDEGILVNVVAGRVRLVTHVDVTREDVEGTVSAWAKLAAEAAGRARG